MHWVHCANEDRDCIIPGTRLVRYGIAPDRYVYKILTDSVGCMLLEFNLEDPAIGEAKTCAYYDFSVPQCGAGQHYEGGGSSCVSNTRNCSFSLGDRSINATRSWIVNNGVGRWGPCSINGQCGSLNGVFTNSLPSEGRCSSGTEIDFVSSSTGWSWTCSGINGGTNMGCSANLLGWVHCADENSNCVMTGTKLVRFGIDSDKYAYKVFTGTVSCMLGTFNLEGSTFYAGNRTCSYYNSSVLPTCSANRHYEGGSSCVSNTRNCSLGIGLGNTTQSWISSNGVGRWTPCLMNGRCGPLNGTSVLASSLPSVGRCSSGTEIDFAPSGTGWTWTCSGINGGTSTGCSATKLIECEQGVERGTLCGGGMYWQTGSLSGIIVSPKDTGTRSSLFMSTFEHLGFYHPLAESNMSTRPVSSLDNGLLNSNNFLGAYGRGSKAAVYCIDLVVNGFTGWYLPASNELNMLLGDFNTNQGNRDFDMLTSGGVPYNTLTSGSRNAITYLSSTVFKNTDDDRYYYYIHYNDGAPVRAMSGNPTVMYNVRCLRKAPFPQSGQCGSLNGTYTLDNYLPTGTGRCLLGTESGFVSLGGIGLAGTGWTWRCNGINNGTNVSCFAHKTINGRCGLLNRTYTYATVLPATGTGCLGGTASDFVSSSTGWFWNCNGINNGTNTGCYILKNTNGRCGNLHRTYTYATVLPETGTGLCSSGTLTNTGFNTDLNRWNWTCSGINLGTSTGCLAYKNLDGICGSVNRQSIYSDTFPGSCSGGTLGTTGFTLSINRWTWNCNGINSGTSTGCYANKNIDGQCGPLNGTYTLASSLPNAGRCSFGTVTGVVFSGTGWTWTCSGMHRGTNASCFANKIINGRCGLLDKTYTHSTVLPSVGRCFSGTIESDFVFSGTGWTWNCNGINNGTNTGCLAYKNLNGICGSINGQSIYSDTFPPTDELYTELYTDGLCSSGTLSPINYVTSTKRWTWTCSGMHRGTNASCFTKKMIDGQCGPLNGTSVLVNYLPSGGHCSGGTTLANFVSLGIGGANTGWTWNCNGINSGANVGCRATRHISGWVNCAAEYSDCELPGTKLVRFGINPDKYVYKFFTDPFNCRQENFNWEDPALNEDKICSYYNSFTLPTCGANQHYEGGHSCVSNTRNCSLGIGLGNSTQSWIVNDGVGKWGPCGWTN